jgi:hypothetical protein
MNDDNWVKQVDPPPQRKFVERTPLKDDPEWQAMGYLSIAGGILMLFLMYAWDYIEKTSDPCNSMPCHEMYGSP